MRKLLKHFTNGIHKHYEAILAALAGVCLILWFVCCVVLGVRLMVVVGSSMEPTLSSRDLILTTMCFNANDLRRGDIVTFHTEADSHISYVKRVIGLPGETVEAWNGVVSVNGKPVDYVHGTGTFGPIFVPRGSIFVLGDNRGISLDSRVLGCIPYSQIEAKAVGNYGLLS